MNGKIKVAYPDLGRRAQYLFELSVGKIHPKLIALVLNHNYTGNEQRIANTRVATENPKKVERGAKGKTESKMLHHACSD